jgi:hypothetical protein
MWGRKAKMLSFKLRNNADWRQPFMLPTTDLTGAALRMHPARSICRPAMGASSSMTRLWVRFRSSCLRLI